MPYHPENPAVSVGDLANNLSKVLHRVEEGHQTVLVTRTGRPVAALVPVDPAQWNEHLRQMAADVGTPTAPDSVTTPD